MASYAELLLASENPTLYNKVRVACVIAAELVRVEAPTAPNHANRLIWARQVYISPESVATRMLWAVLAQNAAESLSVITGATDAAVQAAVNNAVDVFSQGTV